MMIIVILVLLLAKLWGVVAVFCALGQWCFRRLGRRAGVLDTATVGLLILGLAKFVPYLGVWAWMIATFIGVGAALTTKFGRREPWFDGGQMSAQAKG